MRPTILTLVCALAFGCGDDGDSETPDADCSADDAPTYDTFGQAFLEEYCASCHGGDVTGAERMGAPADDVFDTLAQVKAASASLQNEVVTMRTMPFANAPKPTDDERNTFGAWLSCGAP